MITGSVPWQHSNRNKHKIRLAAEGEGRGSTEEKTSKGGEGGARLGLVHMGGSLEIRPRNRYDCSVTGGEGVWEGMHVRLDFLCTRRMRHWLTWSLSVCLSLSLSLSVCVSLCLSFCFSLSVFLSLAVYFLSLSVFLSLCFSLSILHVRSTCV